MGQVWLRVVLVVFWFCGCNLIAPLGPPPPDGGAWDGSRDGDIGSGPTDGTSDGEGGPDQLYDAPGPDAPPPCVTKEDCDDGLTCTKDVCLAGACSNPVVTGWCLIGKTCVPDGQLHPTSECRLCDTATATDAWTDVADATTCDDGVTCTQNDACFHGACMGDVDPGYCVIGPPAAQVCHTAGDVDPSNAACAVCEPSVYTHAWSPQPGCVLTLAGDGSNTVLDGYLLSAKTSEPTDVVVAGAKIYVADTDGHAIRVVERSLVTTLAGCG